MKSVAEILMFEVLHAVQAADGYTPLQGLQL
jgi:hypothetical protein